MRSLLIIGLGLGTFALSACSDNSSTTLKGGACKTDGNCAGGQICVNAVCVSARDAGNQPFGSGGSGGPGAGGGTATGGLTGGGGFGLTDGGPTGTGGLSGGGTAGASGANGAGGRASTDGGPGSGGASGTGGTPAGGVACDTKTCRTGQTCCFTPADPRMPTSVATYTCTASLADGGSGCGAGDTAISCASTGECGAQKCCEVIGRGGVSYSCMARCAQGSPEVACTATSCGATQVCCENLGGGAGTAGLACADTCAANEYQLCSADADCPAPGRGGAQTTCLFSRLSPLFKVCR